MFYSYKGAGTALFLVVMRHGGCYFFFFFNSLRTNSVANIETNKEIIRFVGRD